VPPIQDLPETTAPIPRKRLRRATLTASLSFTGLAALFASLAFATVTPTLSASHNSMLSKTIVVDARGRTLYALSPETAHHLLCRSQACLEVWRPVTVRSRAVGLHARGVEGHLALLKRSDGKLQVTLRGLPLYRFSGDSANGDAHGDGIRSFGGRWHVVIAMPWRTAPSTMAPAMSPPPGYGY
jgi:predicted lipoprotein with Yx(FWY)xxD motif